MITDEFLLIGHLILYDICVYQLTRIRYSQVGSHILAPPSFYEQASRLTQIHRARILAAAGSVDYLIFSFLAYFVIERFGRRKVMMTSAFACSTCWIMISIATGLSEHDLGNKFKLGALAVSFFFIFFASFALGVLGVPVCTDLAYVFQSRVCWHCRYLKDI